MSDHDLGKMGWILKGVTLSDLQSCGVQLGMRKARGWKVPLGGDC